nr:zinc finger, CCHC-type, retrotransposon Gag domain protein [Tanacetum cinerariifolium]
MVNTRTDADLSAAVQNALQTLLPQIGAEIREEFHTSSGPAAAGTEEEQANNFQWGLRRSTLNHLMCMSYTNVAQVANAARNYEILHERDDDTERPDKRRVVIDISRPLSRVVTGATVIITTVIDQTGKVKDCKKNTTASTSG